MHVRGGSQWQSRRKASLGPLRRAHPASGATWNVQVVRGKMTSRCLWHACRALVLGIVLMMVGGGMATVGYYANNFPSLSDVKSNSTSTVHVKNEHRGLHLNNLSYVGPIIMGVGGFIVVASCVMTFEARDSAAKVVPARFKLSSNTRNTSRNNASRRSTSISNGPGTVGSQTARWEQHLGVFRTSPAVEQVPDRKALTAALVHFSRALGTPKATRPSSPCESSRRVSRSGSVPNLTGDKPEEPGGLHHHSHHHNHHQQAASGVGSPAGVRSVVRHHRGPRVSSMVHRSTRETNGGSSLLHPGMLHIHRHAQSFDEPEPFPKTLNQTGSHGSMMHYGCPTDIPIVHKLRGGTKRSDTARKHVLSRQTKIEKEDPGSPKPGGQAHQQQQQQQGQQNPFANSRRSSTISNASSAKMNKSGGSRRASTISKTPSVDSRGAASTVEVNSPERSLLAMTTPRKANAMAQTPSVERECRSQLSICSEPAPNRNLSCQSSLEPCVPEEDSPELEDPPPQRKKSPAATSEVLPATTTATAVRPDSLVLDGDGQSASANEKTNRFLYRSNSTKSFRKPKPKIESKKMSNEFDQIYVISSGGGGGVHGQSSGGTGSRYPNFYHAKDDECYDSIDVIHERRSKNFSKFNSVCGGEDEPLQLGKGPESGSEPEVVGLGSNKFSVVADISPAMANLVGSQEKLLPEEAPLKSCAIDSAEQRLLSGSTEDEDEDDEGGEKARTSGRHVTDHNGSIQRYDTVIYNAAGAGGSSVESEETPEADKETDDGGLLPEGTGAPPGGDNGDDGATFAGGGAAAATKTGTKLGEGGDGDDDGNNSISRQSCV